MAQYINKSDVVIAIDKLISNGKLKCQQAQENNDQISYIAWSEYTAACEKMLSFINTLEVKEVDLNFEKELYKAFGQIKDFTLGVHIARHFFELGLKAQKGE